MQPIPDRVIFGLAAAVLSTLLFHQGMWALLHQAGLMPPPFPTDLVPPFGLPRIYNLCLWSGVWGIPFGLLQPWFPRGWAPGERGLATGVAAALTGLFLLPMLHGQPVAGDWAPLAFVRAFLINGSRGLGLGVLYHRLPLWTSREVRPD